VAITSPPIESLDLISGKGWCMYVCMYLVPGHEALEPQPLLGVLEQRLVRCHLLRREVVVLMMVSSKSNEMSDGYSADISTFCVHCMKHA
jgi:hypothetical protein